MPLTNRDASQLTLRKQQKILYSWNANNTVLVNLGTSVLRAQPTFQSNSVVIDTRKGGCVCATDALANPYEFNGLTQCGCGY